MVPLEKIQYTQNTLQEQNLDGWLLYDFRRMNSLACQFLEISEQALLTRRFFYWIPKEGEPVKIVNAIEDKQLDHLPGKKQIYRSWQELERHLQAVLQGAKVIAMEYSPRNANPYVSKVDGGTLDLVRSFQVEVVSSADLLQVHTSVWTEFQWKTHLKAAQVLDATAATTWKFIKKAFAEKQPLSEYDVQQFILSQIQDHGCIMEGSPICAVNAHSADPHYTPQKEGSSLLHPGDFVLIDLWCKQDCPQAVYADITRVAVPGGFPTEKQQAIFEIVKKAQEAGTALVKERLSRKEPLMGWEVDQCCRQVIGDAGYGEYFIHRTGHNIGEQDHGNGAHLDNLETQDRRRLLPGTCFSIEPGIYLPGEFGIRLEYDVFIHWDGTVHVTGGDQDEWND